MEIEKYKYVQSIAKKVLKDIEKDISEESTESTIANKCKELFKKHGINKTWYYDCPALVLLGSRSCVSISGKDYKPSSKEKVGLNNLLTIDLSPLKDDIWGDCARSYVMEDGVIKQIEEIKNKELKAGIEMEKKLHKHLTEIFNPGMTYEEIYKEMNEYITTAGYENIDFMKNIGHTIEINKDDRQYFMKGNKEIVKIGKLFTLEPHIKKVDGKWGYKCENIYYFNEEKLEEL
jgi:Xaa-Pro aminopeptidase